MIAFGPFRLDRDAGRVWRGDEPVTLPPRPLAVLAYLVERPGRTVSTAELLAAVWPDAHVTRTSVKVCVRAVREALGDDVLAPRYVETVGREGYRFHADVRGVAPAPAGRAGADDVVGREAERAALARLLAEASAGGRRLVFVTGEAGIGKTALLDAFLAGVRAAGEARAGRGQCLEQYGEGEAYLPVLEALGQLARGVDGSRVRALLARCAPTWLAQMPALAAELGRAPGPAGDTISRERMLREAAELVETIAAERPLVLALEDLHWSDRATLDLLAYLAERREPAPLLVLATYRPADAVASGHPVAALARTPAGARPRRRAAGRAAARERGGGVPRGAARRTRRRARLRAADPRPHRRAAALHGEPGRALRARAPRGAAGQRVAAARRRRRPGPPRRPRAVHHAAHRVAGGARPPGARGGGEEGFVHVHQGIHGVGDLLPSARDWRNPVAQVTVQRVRPR